MEERVKTIGLPWGKILPRDSETQQDPRGGKVKSNPRAAEGREAHLKRKLEEATEEVRREKRLNVEVTKKAGWKGKPA
ncbi:hypothetical protein CR513_04900, partial [Mucuna pruriens]